MSSGGQDRRRHARYACDATAEILCFGTRALFRGKVSDLSESGCFVEMRARVKLQAMALVEVTIQVRGLQLRTLACARSVQPGRGAGFEFVTRDPRLRGTLEGVITRIQTAMAGQNSRSESAAASTRR